jgi:lipopolysaccharide transport system ATP-binding protein
VDEVLAVGDAEFQKKCIGKMQSVSEKDGRTVLFVSHNMQAVRQMCQRVIFLQQGKIAYSGDPHQAISAYLGKGQDAASQASIDLTDYPRPHGIDGATFLRVRFTDGKGDPASRLRLEDTLGVEMDIQVQRPLRQFNVSMAVIHGEGLRLFSEAYSDQYAQPDLEPGKFTLRFQVPMRFFKMESYFLSLTLNEKGHTCDHIDGLLLPEIVAENPNLQMETHRWGVLRVPVTWSPIKT